MRQRLVESVELSTHVHATEDELKVARALLNLIPPELRPKAKLETSVGEGFFGNMIKSLKASFRGRESALVASYILKSMDQLDRAIIVASLNSRFSEGRLYLRFNKQLAYSGVIRLDDGDDVVKTVIKFNYWSLKSEGGIVNAIKKLIVQQG